MKKALSVLFFTAVAAYLLTVSVSAASGYAADPGYDYPVPISQPSAVIEEENNVLTAVGRQTITAAAASSDAVQVTGSVKITKEALAEIVKSGKSAVFETENGVLLKIDPESITDQARGIDISMNVYIFDKTQQTDNKLKLSANSVIISPAAEGEFGFTVLVTVPKQTITDAGLDGNNINLFCIGENGSIAVIGKAMLNGGGSVTFPVSRASTYVLAEEDSVSYMNGNKSDNAKPNAVMSTETSEAVSGTEKNPNTGVMLTLTAAGAAGLIALVFKRVKK